MIVQNNKEISVLPLSCPILDERGFFISAEGVLLYWG